jgi:serine/threonine-protein kinase
MKLVRGRTLSSLLAERRSPAHDLPRFLSIFEAICQTVAYAHARSVIHRDLKPSNVMVGSFGEVQVMDWGLAKVLKGAGLAEESPTRPAAEEGAVATARSGSDVDESQAGSALGTPAYMAPEQAAGALERVDRRSDVFGLGSILCEVLTGQAVYTGRGAPEVVRKAMRGETAEALARLEGCGAEAGLIALAKDCLAVGPEDRPRDAGRVAERMTAYLAGVQERVQAAERARAVAVARAIEERRRRKVQLALAASVLALTTLGGLSTTYYLQQQQARAAAGQRVIDQVATLHDQALARPEEIRRWEVALAAVEQADPAGDSRTKAQLLALQEAIRAGLDGAERDARVRQQLVEVRANQQDVGAEGTDAVYAAAYRAAGLDLEALEPAEFARRLRLQGEAAVIELSAFLDHWSVVRRWAGRPVAAWRKPLEAARRADPEPYRDRLRGVLLAEDRKPQAEALKALATAREAAELPAPTAVLLGNTLADLGQAEAAVALLRGAAGRHPGDVWVNYVLARALEGLRPPAREEAVRYYTAARALRPETAHELAHLLERMGRGAEGEAVFRDLVGRRPEDARHLVCLGNHLRDRGRSAEAAPILDRAVAAARAAIRLGPDDAGAHTNLGLALRGQGKLSEAIAAHREAIRLQPDLAGTHNNLGGILCDVKHDYTGAEAEFRAAIRLQPHDAAVHYNLGRALHGQGKVSEAIVAHREAIRLQPDLAGAHTSLGGILCDVKHDYTGAEAEFRSAIRLKPDDALAHTSLGIALRGQGKVSEAIAEYREAIRLRPDYAEAHCNLGLVLRSRGEYAAALDALRTGHALGSKRPGWPCPSAEWVREAERLAALADRLPAILRGDDRPADNAERLALAQICYDTKRPAAAVRFWAEALAADPKLGDDRRAGHLYNAACAAALAGSGQGADDPKPDDTARARLRGQALDWLEAELAAWARVLDAGDPQARSVVAQDLRHWQADPDLAGVRDRDALAKLPADERRAWAALWKDVDALLEGAARPGPTVSKPDGATPVRQGGPPAESRPSAPPRESLAPATPRPDDAEALDRIHKRAHQLAPSQPAEAEPLFRQTLEGYRQIQGPDGALTLDLTLDLANLLDQAGRDPEAELLFRVGLEAARKRFGADDPRTAGILAVRGLSLVRQGKWAEAEPVLRECLAIRERSQPDEWSTFNTRSLLGGSLLGQKKYAEAEPLIVSGYEGMRAREARIPPPGRPRLTEAFERVLKLYEAWGQPDKVAEWRARLAKPSAAAEKRP